VVGGNRLIGLAEFFSHEVAQPDPELLALLSTVGAQIGQFSERKRAELEADRLKDEFFALVSHELRTPLTSIIGYLELVQEDADALDPQSTRFLQVVERNSRRLHRLVGDLLFVAQVEAGRLSLDSEAVPLAGVVADCVEAARPRAEESGVTLRARTDDVGTLKGDGDRLGQMLDNLVSNAVKFTAEGGTVDVYLARRGDKALLEVRDSGIGIPDAEQHRLFQRFFRSSTATEQAIPGVGLGLTISRAIVEAHGGTIGFESEEGRGTTFRVELPLEAQRLVPDPIESPREVVL
jgi:signal transduction histidine kinase